MHAVAKSFSVIICVHADKRWRSILEAVGSARAQTLPPQQILIVVDHNDLLKARLERALSGVTIIANSEASGLSGARNTGVANATGEFLVFLDDDAALEPDWIRKAVIWFEDDRCLGVMSRIVPNWDGPQPGWFPDEFLWVVGCTYAGATPGSVRNLIGAAMCVSRRAFNVVGGFSDRLGRAASGLPMGCEETEFCIRAAAAMPESCFIFDDAAFAKHRVSGERLTRRYFVRRCFAEGRSKGLLASMTSPGRALSTERSYTLRVLPRGVAKGVADGARGDLSGFGRAAAIIYGFAATVAGYASGKGVLLMARRRARADRSVAIEATE